MILDVYSKASFSRSRLLRNDANYEAFVIPGQTFCILLINFTISWKSTALLTRFEKKNFDKRLTYFQHNVVRKVALS